MITPSFGLTATERVLPKLALDFTTASLDSRVTFSRTTDATHPATYVNSNGYVTAATNDQPRFDYDPVTLACKGLLIEESRSNILLYSSTFDNTTGWPSKVNINTPAASAAISPDGTSDAYKIYENTNTGTHVLYKTYTLTAASYTASVYAKAAGRTYFRLYTDPSDGGAVFNLSAGTITSTSAGKTATITPVGNGWYRCTVSFTGTAASWVIGLQLYLNGTTASYAGDGTSGIYVYGAQLEAGAFATSYIPTTSAALTRNDDVAVMTGTNFSDWYNQSQGSFVTEYQLEGFGTAQARTGIGVSNGTTGERMRTLVTASTQVGSLGNGAGTSFTFLQTVPNVTANVNKTAYAYALNNAAGCSNAGAVNTDTSFTPPTVDRATIGCAEDTAASVFTNGWIKKLMYYGIRLTNSELKSITK